MSSQFIIIMMTPPAKLPPISAVKPSLPTRHGSKLSLLLSELLGANSRVHGIASVASGQPRHTVRTLRLASLLRRIDCYPVLNSPAASGLIAIGRSEKLALLDLYQMKTRHRERGDGAGVEDKESDEHGEASPGGLASLGREGAIEESRLEGKLIGAEVEKEQLKEVRCSPSDSRCGVSSRACEQARLRLVRERDQLQARCEVLLAEKKEVEKQQLESEGERLRVAKALVELEIDANANESESVVRVSILCPLGRARGFLR